MACLTAMALTAFQLMLIFPQLMHILLFCTFLVLEQRRALRECALPCWREALYHDHNHRRPTASSALR